MPARLFCRCPAALRSVAALSVLCVLTSLCVFWCGAPRPCCHVTRATHAAQQQASKSLSLPAARRRRRPSLAPAQPSRRRSRWIFPPSCRSAPHLIRSSARPALRLLRLLHLQLHLPVLVLPVRHHDLRSAVRNLTPPSPRVQAASIFDAGVAGTATGDYEKLRKKLGAITCGIVTACLMLTFYVLDLSYQGDGSSVHSGGTYGKASAQPPKKALRSPA